MDKEKEFGGKKILFIAPKYFEYEVAIINKLEYMGADVKYIQENIDYTSYLYHAIRKIPFIKLKEKIFCDYFKKQIQKVKEVNFDYVFVIRGALIPELIIKQLKERYKECKFINYQWDSFKNVPMVKKHFKYFDYIYTFDRQDYIRYSNEYSNLKYKALFYDDSKFKYEEVDKNIDLLFIGSYHSDRYEIINRVKKICDNEKINFIHHLYIPKGIFIKKRLLGSELKNKDYSIFKFNKLTLAEVNSLMNRSKAILDIENTEQTGLTMRTIEALGKGKQVITFNENIVYEEFYNTDAISIIKRENIDIKINNYKEINKHIAKYKLSNWIKDILYGY